MIENINPYNEIEFRTTFTNTKIYKKLKQDFGEKNLVWYKFFFSQSTKLSSLRNGTPRKRYSNKFSISVFHYLLPMIEQNYDAIYDIGCGANLFKPYLPCLVGVGAEEIILDMQLVDSYNIIKDPTWPMISNKKDFENLPDWIKQECTQQHKMPLPLADFYGDVHGFVDDVYIQEHQNYFQSVFSICALHYRSLQQFRKIVADFSSMIKHNGRAFLSLNLQRLIDATADQFLLQKFSTADPTKLQYEQYLRQELSTLNLKFLILDIDLTIMDASMDGNIRLVFER